MQEPPLKKFLHQSSHYLLGNISLMLSGFISFPILTRVLSTQDYGLLSLISITLWISLALTKAGLQEAAVRFYDEFESGKRKATLSTFYTTLLFAAVLFALLIAAGVAGIGFIIFKETSFKNAHTLIWLLAGLIITGSLFLRLVNFLRAEQRSKMLNLILILRQYSTLLLGILFLFTISRSITSYYSGIVLAEAGVVLLLLLLLYRNGYIHYKAFSIPFLKESLIFGIPLIGFEMANFLIKSVDRYLIQIFINLEAVGIYAAGSNLCQYLKDSVLYAVLYAITPIYIQLWNQEGAEKTREFISRVIHYLFYLLVPITFGFIALGKPLVILLASEKYQQSASIIPIILPGIMLWGLSPLFAAGLYIQKKTKLLSVIVFAGVIINGVLNMVLIPRYHIAGAAWATLFSFIALSIALIKISHPYLKIHVEPASFLRSVLVSGLMFLLLKLIPLHGGALILLLKILIGVGFYTFAILLVDQSLRKTLRAIFPLVKIRRLQTHSEKI